jgi:hypothetical protein
LEEDQAYQKIMILDNLKRTTFLALDIKLAAQMACRIVKIFLINKKLIAYR